MSQVLSNTEKLANFFVEAKNISEKTFQAFKKRNPKIKLSKENLIEAQNIAQAIISASNSESVNPESVNPFASYGKGSKNSGGSSLIKTELQKQGVSVDAACKLLGTTSGNVARSSLRKALAALVSVNKGSFGIEVKGSDQGTIYVYCPDLKAKKETEKFASQSGFAVKDGNFKELIRAYAIQPK